MGRFEGKIAVVTGAGNGLGRAHAMALAAEGAKVLVNDIGRSLVDGAWGGGLQRTGGDISAAQAVVAEIEAQGGTAVANATDVSSVKAASSVVEAAVEAFGDIHILVNNAGSTHATDIDDIDDERLEADYFPNVKGTAGTTRAAFEVMKRKGHGGVIVNTITGFGGFPAGHGLVGYNAAKYAVASYTISSAAAGIPLGIRVNAYCPTAITRLSRRWFVEEGYLDDDDKQITQHMSPERISPIVMFLASDDSGDLTGRLIITTWTGIGADVKLLVKEVFVAETEGAISEEWTSESLVRATPEFVRMDDTQGQWASTLAASGATTRPVRQ